MKKTGISQKVRYACFVVFRSDFERFEYKALALSVSEAESRINPAFLTSIYPFQMDTNAYMLTTQ